MSAKKYFGTDNLYEILNLQSNAQIQEGKTLTFPSEQDNTIYSILVKANYYKLAKVHHPDRVSEEQKTAAKERFSIIHHAYTILVNSETKAIYDAGKTDLLIPRTTVAAKWEQYIKTIRTEDIESARAKYQGSFAEETDVLREFTAGKGSIIHLLNGIIMRYEDENRIIEIIKRGIENGQIQKIAIRKIRR